MESLNIKSYAKDKLEFVSSVIMNDEGKILLLKRKNNLKLDPGKYDLCSGHIKENEAPMQAMYRELKEELGLNPEQINKMELMGVIETPHKKLKNTLTHIYTVQINEKEEDLNKNVKEVLEPEIESVRYIDSAKELYKMIKETEEFRTELTYQLEIVLEVVEDKIKRRKEEKNNLCQEK